jgi:hypothetical protein
MSAKKGHTSKGLDRKLAHILSGEYTPTDFIIADAKDADMSVGLMAPGPNAAHQMGDSGPGVYRTRQEYISQMQALMDQGEIDIMLASAANIEKLTKTAATDHQVTFAIRGNDATDIWNPRSSDYLISQSQPFQSVNLKKTSKFCDLALYSLTLNNDLDSDVKSLNAYKDFRIQAADLGVRHFLEVFNPNAPVNLRPSDFGSFVNDSIIRALAGVTEDERPLFLKIAYNGSAHVQELAEHDSTLVVGLLGGSAGSARDTFELLHRGEKAGARVALFGRKIQRAQSQTEFVALMRPVIEGKVTPEQAVQQYHDALERQGITADRTLAADLELTDPALRDE